MHTEPAAQTSNAMTSPMLELHANCPNCGRTMAAPILDVHHDGSHCGYCAACRTEVFEASVWH